MQTLMALFFILWTGYQTEFKSEDAIINVDINSNIYVYKITNLSQKPVVEIRIPQHSGYNFEVPENWKILDEKDMFTASTEDSLSSIQAGSSAIFSFRISSRGAILGKGNVKLVTNQNKELIIPGVYIPVPESQLYIFLVGGILVGLVLLHTILLVRKHPKQD
jgi:hypothetical protein